MRLLPRVGVTATGNPLVDGHSTREESIPPNRDFPLHLHPSWPPTMGSTSLLDSVRTIFLSLFSSKPLSLAQTRLCPGEAPSYCRLLLCGAPAVWDALSGGGRRWSLAALARQVGLAVPLLSRAEDQDDVSPSPVPVIVQLCPRAEAAVSRFLPPGLRTVGWHRGWLCPQ